MGKGCSLRKWVNMFFNSLPIENQIDYDLVIMSTPHLKSEFVQK